MEPLITKTSSVSRFRSGSRSVKTTIPVEVAELLKIKPGDVLIWEVRMIDSERFADVKKAPRLEGAK
jgi:bifunctional DNA-binding transcriptional regulator/antitoxin component of YhaV-PrlF toxin-antitoxin module